jgi:hypothetical protein
MKTMGREPRVPNRFNTTGKNTHESISWTVNLRGSGASEDQDAVPDHYFPDMDLGLPTHEVNFDETVCYDHEMGNGTTIKEMSPSIAIAANPMIDRYWISRTSGQKLPIMSPMAAEARYLSLCLKMQVAGLRCPFLNA